MTCQVTLTFPSVEEAIEFLSRDKVTVTQTVPVVSVAPVAEAPKKRGRPAKQAQPEVAQNTGSGTSPVAPSTPASDGGSQPQEPEGSASPAAVDPAPVKPGVGEAAETAFTTDDLRKALAAVNEKKGLAFARELLVKFGAGRVSEVKEDQYAEVIAACKAAVE
jgi:hypothetical protein